MKLEMIKGYGGILAPASEDVADKLAKFKTNEMYVIEIKRTRSPQFHRKVFAFFNFIFEHWAADKVEQLECMDEPGQKAVFRKWITCKAGYYDSYFNPEGGVRIEAKSLAFGNMDQAEFEACYSALINAAIKHVFSGTTDEKILNRLQEFF